MKILLKNRHQSLKENENKPSIDWEKMREWLKEKFPKNWKEIERGIIIPALSAAAIIHPIIQPEYYFEENKKGIKITVRR